TAGPVPRWPRHISGRRRIFQGHSGHRRRPAHVLLAHLSLRPFPDYAAPPGLIIGKEAPVTTRFIRVVQLFKHWIARTGRAMTGGKCGVLGETRSPHRPPPAEGGGTEAL